MKMKSSIVALGLLGVLTTYLAAKESNSSVSSVEHAYRPVMYSRKPAKVQLLNKLNLPTEIAKGSKIEYLVFPSGHINAIQVNSSSNIVLYGNEWIETNDGGRTWEYLSREDFYFNAYRFYETAYAKFLVGSNNQILRQTKNGEWQSYELKAKQGEEKPTTSNPMELMLLSAVRGGGVDYYSMCSSPDGKLFATGSLVTRSMNRGESWHATRFPENTREEGRIVIRCHFTGANDGYAFSTVGEIFETKDGGDSWRLNNELTKKLGTNRITGFLAIGDSLYLAGHDLFLWNLKKNSIQKLFSTEKVRQSDNDRAIIRNLLLAPDGRSFYFVSDNKVERFNIVSKRVTNLLTLKPDFKDRLNFHIVELQTLELVDKMLWVGGVQTKGSVGADGRYGTDSDGLVVKIATP